MISGPLAGTIKIKEVFLEVQHEINKSEIVTHQISLSLCKADIAMFDLMLTPYLNHGGPIGIVARKFREIKQSDDSTKTDTMVSTVNLLSDVTLQIGYKRYEDVCVTYDIVLSMSENDLDCLARDLKQFCSFAGPVAQFAIQVNLLKHHYIKKSIADPMDCICNVDGKIETCIRNATQTPVGPQGPQGSPYTCTFCSIGLTIRAKAGYADPARVYTIMPDLTVQS
jgi:hypothetical protein